MKIDRLLNILIYLLNRDTVTTKVLSERFDVSTRTIQRDIETLNQAGIPIFAINGRNGGFGIMENFKLNSQLIDSKDSAVIVTALKGLCSAFDHKRADSVLEKIENISISKSLKAPKISLDFSILKEGEKIQQYLSILESAIENKKIVRFLYYSANGTQSRRTVESVILVYKWYSWYLYSFCREKKDYRYFKVCRIQELIVDDILFSNIHVVTEESLCGKVENKSYEIKVKAKCDTSLRIPVEEYFPNSTISRIDEKTFLMEMCVPKYERMWYALILSFGNLIKIIEPEELRIRINRSAKEILEVY